MPFVTTRDDVNLYYKDWGQGRPVVLVHGWPLNADMWDYTANGNYKELKIVTLKNLQKVRNFGFFQVWEPPKSPQLV